MSVRWVAEVPRLGVGSMYNVIHAIYIPRKSKFIFGLHC